MDEFRKLLGGLVFGAVMVVGALVPVVAAAHCDTVDGPVVRDGRVALAKGEVTPALKWVRAEDEAAVRDIFGKAAAARAGGGVGAEVAEWYFLENLVRIHRAGEGAPYTGLRPAGAVEPALVMADKALTNGSVEGLVDGLSRAMIEGVRARFDHVRAARSHAEESVVKGRDYVAAYVDFIHHVERLHQDVEGEGGHHPVETTAAPVVNCPHHRQ
ncbi:MAG: DUF6448 family protein [Desulfobulbaceae bacterium]|nr:DUF6448 family protein [Desulfobulbaceae bacterium]